MASNIFIVFSHIFLFEMITFHWYLLIILKIWKYSFDVNSIIQLQQLIDSLISVIILSIGFPFLKLDLEKLY